MQVLAQQEIEEVHSVQNPREARSLILTPVFHIDGFCRCLRRRHKKRFQVIRFPASPTTGMHGTELRVQERRTFRLSAPLKPFSPASGSMLQDSPQPSSFSPQRSRNLVTAFPSPRTAATSLRPPFQGQCSRPATSLPASPLPCPFGPSAPSPSPVRPGQWQLLRVWPVAVPLQDSTGRFPCLHSPSGLLHPSGSKCSAGSAARQLTFRLRPISSRSPTPVLFLGLASDHRSWSATFPETDCSSNLLEPPSLCTPAPGPVNAFVNRKT